MASEASSDPTDVGPVVVGEFDIHVKGSGVEESTPAKFFFDYQQSVPVWARIEPQSGSWSVDGSILTVRAPGRLEAFEGYMATLGLHPLEETAQLVGRLNPTTVPIESAPARDLAQITLALLDSPISKDFDVFGPRRDNVILRCNGFEVTITPPSIAHEQVSRRLGSSPHRLTETVSITRPGELFKSREARRTLDILHDALSFAAGRWSGMTLVEGRDASDQQVWSRWGTTRMSTAPTGASWFDPEHPEWLESLCDSFRRLQSNEETWEAVRTALYWYVRSNSLNSGVDSSLILSQCALELLSWLVIVRLKRALSEEGYGQLSNAAEKLRLTLTLLDIPRHVPAGLKNLLEFCSKMKDSKMKDLPDVVVQARNYLVHPTQSRSGRRRATREWPWHELWIAAQWLLELVLLSLLGYEGNYRNRTRLTDLRPIERVPWAR